MAKKATGRSKSDKSRRTGTAVVRRTSSSGRPRSQDSMGDAFIKLLQSPLVAELGAVASSSACAARAEQGFTSSGEGSRGKRAGKAVKAAGRAAAA